VMWAERPEISFLRSPDETKSMLEAAGFRVQHWIDNTETAKAEAAAERNRATGQPAAPPVLGIHVVVGASAGEKLRNMQTAMADGRIRLINAVLVKV
jgi:hypothetical protein